MARKSLPKTCNSCDRPMVARGLCSTHYWKARVSGEMDVLPKLSIKEQLLEYSMPVTETGCWIWLRSTKNGYGNLAVGDKIAYAHRTSYETFKGPIPDGLYVCHTCDVKLCINPDHLWLGTHQDNMDDMVRKGRHWTHKR